MFKNSIKNKVMISPCKLMLVMAVFFLVLYPYSVSIGGYIYRGTILKYLTLLFSAFSFVFVYYSKCGKGDNRGCRVSINNIEIFMFFIGVYITLNNFDIKNGSYYYVILYWVIFIVAITSKYLSSWQVLLFKMMKCFTMFYAIITIICFISRQFYMSYIIPLFDSESQAQLIKAYNNGYMAGLTDHYSTNGMYLSIGFGLFASELLGNMRQKRKWFLTIIMLGALLLTGKRGPLLFSIISLVIVFYFYKEDRPNGRILKILGIVFLGIIVLLIASIWIPELLNVVERFVNESDGGDITAGRGPLYELAIEEFKKNPILGNGWGSYPYSYYDNLGKYMTVYKYRHAHNIYLQLLSEVGLVGFSIYISFFVYNAITTLRVFKEYRKDNIYLSCSADYILPFCLFVQLFFLFYGMTGNPLYDVAVLSPYYFSFIYVNYYKKNLVKLKSTRKIIKTLCKEGAVFNCE